MRILSVHGKLSVIERCPHGEVRLYLKVMRVNDRKHKIFLFDLIEFIF